MSRPTAAVDVYDHQLCAICTPGKRPWTSTVRNLKHGGGVCVPRMMPSQAISIRLRLKLGCCRLIDRCTTCLALALDLEIIVAYIKIRTVETQALLLC